MLHLVFPNVLPDGRTITVAYRSDHPPTDIHLMHPDILDAALDRDDVREMCLAARRRQIHSTWTLARPDLGDGLAIYKPREWASVGVYEWHRHEDERTAELAKADALARERYLPAGAPARS